jgi:arabinogalactan oligomer / maltooligosaccharide transport system substrate-binding protein
MNVPSKHVNQGEEEMSKKVLTVISFLLIATLVLAACAPTAAPETPAPAEPAQLPTQPPGAEPAQPTQPPAAEPTQPPAQPAPDETVITVWSQWEGRYLDAIQQVFRDYESQNPGVRIVLEQPENVNDALRVAIPAGEGPDIIAWANDQIGTQALAGNIAPLDDYGIDMAFLDNTYEPAAVNGVVWQDMIWGLPEAQEGIALVYNRAAADEADFPSDPLDFQDLLAKAEAYYQENNAYLFCNQALGGQDAYHVAPIYFGHGVPEYVDDQGNAYLDTDEALAAGEFLVDLSAVHPSETSHEICRTMLFEGQAAAWWTGPWAIADLEAEGIDYGILPMGRPFAGIKVLLLSQNAVDRGNAETAVDIMRYFTGSEAAKQMSLANKTIPANTQALNDPEVQALPTLAGFGEALNLAVPMANTPYAGAQWGPVGDATLAIWTGVQEPGQALADAQAAIDTAIEGMR